MKVILKRDSEYVEFGDVTPGDVFLYKDGFYMKLSETIVQSGKPLTSTYITAINLTSGVPAQISDGADCLPIKGKFVEGAG